ncbi:MAG: CPBP family intramembrane metalloprotease [Flavobacterium sp.]|nr:MAG: CPBP family intramembrane metalloprotease [Flavobacterium sp.]
MTKKESWRQLLIFVVIYLLILLTREYLINLLFSNHIESYRYHTLLKIGTNLILILISYFFIQKNGLLKLAGIKDSKLKKWHLLLFPLYLAMLNLVSLESVNMGLLLPNLALLIIYSITIGVSEELSIRGFIQSYLIKRFDLTKKNIILSILASSIFFGVMHWLNFDKCLYGELSQFFYATFIGVMFGSLLVITKRIYPLIIIHSIIDFVAKIDSTGLPVKQKVAESVSFGNAIMTTLIVLPCIIYGLILLKRIKLIEIEK